MQLDDPYFGGEQPPRSFADACVNGKRLNVWTMIPSLIVFAVLLYELWQGANPMTIMLLVFIGMNCYAMLVAVFRPPQMAIRNGQFALRFGKTKLLCPAADVVDLYREEQAVHLTLAGIDPVDSGEACQQMSTLDRRKGCHIVIPAGIYTLEQVNQLRTALGLPQQSADPAGEEMAEFQSSVASHRPLVTLSLIAACVIVYLAQAYQDKSLLGGNNESFIAWGANFGPRTLDGQWWRLVTHLFLHGNPLHILMNMWVLWDVGRLMERLVGRAALAMIYFFAGIAGGMASVAFHPNVVSVGASGAIFGIIGALFGLLLHARDAVPPARLQQLRSSIIAMVIFCLFFGLSVQGIDNAAHVGGAIAGLLAGLIVLPATSAGHWLRIALLAIVGTGAIVLGTRFLPPPPQNERQILDKCTDLAQKRMQGELSDREFADQLETSVINPWREFTKERSEAIKENPDPAWRAKVEHYMRLRQESFEDLAAAIRDDNGARWAQFRKKKEAAEKIVKELNEEKKER